MHCSRAIIVAAAELGPARPPNVFEIRTAVAGSRSVALLAKCGIITLTAGLIVDTFGSCLKMSRTSYSDSLQFTAFRTNCLQFSFPLCVCACVCVCV